jgi:hypothetical protein
VGKTSQYMEWSRVDRPRGGRQLAARLLQPLAFSSSEEDQPSLQVLSRQGACYAGAYAGLGFQRTVPSGMRISLRLSEV